MSDRLRQLLSETPTEDRLSLDGRFLRDMRNRSESRMDVDYDTVKVARFRSDLVRETMRECAKMMCDGCRRGRSLLIHPQFDGVWLHDNEGDVATECNAQEIQHLLAETEAK